MQISVFFFDFFTCDHQNPAIFKPSFFNTIFISRFNCVVRCLEKQHAANNGTGAGAGAIKRLNGLRGFDEGGEDQRGAQDDGNAFDEAQEELQNITVKCRLVK